MSASTIIDIIDEILADSTGKKITEITTELTIKMIEGKFDITEDFVDQMYNVIEENFTCIEYTLPNNHHIKTFVLPRGGQFSKLYNNGNKIIIVGE